MLGQKMQEIVGYKTQIDELLLQLQNLASENETLKRLLQDKNNDFELFRNNQLQVNNRTMDKLRQAVNEYDKVNQCFDDQLVAVDKLRQRASDLNNGIKLVDNLNGRFRSYNDLFAFLIDQRLKEIDVLKGKSDEYGSLSNEVEELRNQLAYVTRENEKLKQTLTERARDVSTSRNNFEDIRKFLLGADPATLQAAQLRELAMKNDLLITENDRLNRLIQEKNNEIQNL
jgi:chromosome segregation ATPase